MPLSSQASSYPDPIDGLIFFSGISFFISSAIYVILGVLLLALDKLKTFRVLPFFLVAFATLFLTLAEFAMKHIAGGMPGGAILGALIPSFVYFWLTRETKG